MVGQRARDATAALDLGTRAGLVLTRYDSKAGERWLDEVAELHERCGERHVPFVTVGAAGANQAAVSEHMDMIGRRLDSLIEPMARRIATAEQVGEEMVQRWLDAQGIPKLRLLLLDNIRNRLFAEIGKLESAIFNGDADGVRKFAHAIKGWSGTFKMEEIYEIVDRIDGLAQSGDLDLVELRWDAVDLIGVLAKIPRKYLMDVEPAPEIESTERELGLGLHALVVDDNDINRDLAGTLLSRQGITYDEAENGAVAIEKMRTATYDVVLMDVEMPVMNGWQAIAAIRADPDLKDAHVVALTAHALVGVEDDCRAAGFSDYLAKPIDRMELYARLTDLARSTSATRS